MFVEFMAQRDPDRVDERQVSFLGDLLEYPRVVRSGFITVRQYVRSDDPEGDFLVDESEKDVLETASALLSSEIWADGLGVGSTAFGAILLITEVYDPVNTSYDDTMAGINLATSVMSIPDAVKPALILASHYIYVHNNSWWAH